MQSLEAIRPVPSAPPPPDLGLMNALAAEFDPRELVAWADGVFGDGLVLSTSFGIQSAAMLHLATRVRPRIPVVWVDTGYLPAETYRFAESLTQRLDLNLVVAQSELSPARMEGLHGRLWEDDDPEALALYQRIRKVEPMRATLDELGARAWLSGIRADQTRHRSALARVSLQDGRFKISPILHWHSRDVHRYLHEHDLPLHPWFERGYAHVSDWHSTRRAVDDDTRSSRFGGRIEECGIHLADGNPDAAASFDASGL